MEDGLNRTVDRDLEGNGISMTPVRKDEINGTTGTRTEGGEALQDGARRISDPRTQSVALQQARPKSLLQYDALDVKQFAGTTANVTSGQGRQPPKAIIAPGIDQVAP